MDAKDPNGHTFTFNSRYEENSTLSLVTASGWSVGIGSKLGVGGREKKTLEFTGRVGSGRVVMVKELTYNIKRIRYCEVELFILYKKDEIPYFKNEKEEKVKMTKSSINKLAEKKGIVKQGDHLVISLKGPFTFKNVTRSLRVQQSDIEEKQKKRIAPAEDVDPFGTVVLEVD